MTIRIFICYSQDDFKGRGIKLRNYLSKVVTDSEVYIDQSKLKGQKWREINNKKLEEADIVLVILTPAALQSHEVAREVHLAQKLKKTILPCKDDNLELDWKEIPWDLDTLDGINFGDDEVLRTVLFREIMKIIKQLTGKRSIKIAEQVEFGVNLIVVQRGSIPVIVNTQKFELPYLIHSGELSFALARVDKATSSIVIDIDCKKESNFEITLPRSLIDSKRGTDDDIFFVLVDGVDTEFKEITNTDKRILTISVPACAQNVEIIGTQIFGISYPGVIKYENIVKILKGSGSKQVARYFEPEVLTIKRGERVRWENNDTVSHTITDGNPTDSNSGTRFDSGLFRSGKNFDITINEKGIFNYFCVVHPWETGKIIVE